MASEEAKSLISDLASGKRGISGSISTYLRPFKKPPVRNLEQLRSLILKFRPFLVQALTILPEKLHHPLGVNKRVASECFEVYQLCLTCWELISRYVNKPLQVYNHRFELLLCFGMWRRWEDGELEALNIFKLLKQPVKSNNLYLPTLDVNAEYIQILAKTVALMCLCIANYKPKEPHHYQCLLQIVTEFQPWVSVLDTDVCRLVLKDTITHLLTCTSCLVGEVPQFDSKFDLATKFCDIIITTPMQGSHHLTELCDSLYQIGVLMHSNKEFKQASDVFKLHCQATWDVIEARLKEGGTDDNLVFFGKWCEGITSLMRVLSQSECTINGFQDLTKDWAEKWTLKNFQTYCQIQVKIVNGDENGDDAALLGNVFQSLTKVSRKKILQQELLFYVQRQNENPKFCKQMQRKINDLLVKDGFGKPNDWLEESSCLRLCGIKGSNYCIQYLSQVVEISSGHQLAAAYALRSLCTEEYEPNSEKVIQDIRSALDVWSSISSTDHSIEPENLMKILYSILDLLSLKGRVDFHCDIYKVMIEIYTWRGVSLKNLVAKLWESRRISHALCPAPIQEAFINLQDDFGEEFKLTEFWIECFGNSQPLVVGFHNNFSSSTSNITVDNVEGVASELISNGSESGSYLASCLYYDLSEKLVSNGQPIKALRYAMEAHQLRVELFKQNFPWSSEGRDEGYNESGNHVLADRSSASELWSFDSNSCDLDICYVSPWNTLQCYLESILQVGVIHEKLGNADKAEYFLNWGKSLSCSHSLTLFDIIFSSCLGELYHKKQRWASAKKELESANELLKDMTIDGFCSKCRLILEVTVAHNLADLYQSPIHETENTSSERLSADLYKEALVKLLTTEWERSITCPEEQDNTVVVKDGNSQLKGSSDCFFPDTLCKKELPWDLDLQKSVVSFGVDVPCICKTMGCWHCLTAKLTKSGLVTDAIKFKWGLVHRRLLLRLLTGLGKCLENEGQIHEACEIILQSISVLVGPNPFCRASKSTFLPDLMGKEINALRKHVNLYHLLGREFPGEVLCNERAVILYNLCWLSLKERNKDTRNNPHLLIDIPISKLLSWLMLAFVLSREVPAVFQKVSRLLAAIFSLSTSSLFEASLSTSCQDLYGRHWVCFFHQASLGIQFNYQFFLKELQQRTDTKVSHKASGSQSLPWLAPESILDLTGFVKDFFKSLPSTTVICLSLLGCPYSSIFHELLSCSSAPAWIMVSRLNASTPPIHIVLPVHLVPGGNSDGDMNSRENDGREWCCPWGSNVVDDVVPSFRSLMKEIFLLSNQESLSRAANREDYYASGWEERQRIEDSLFKLMKDMEDSWFSNTLQCMLLGEMVNCKEIDQICENLVMELNSKFTNVDITTLKVILLGLSKYGFKGGTDKAMLEFCLKKGCFFGDVCDEDYADELHDLASKIYKAQKKVKGSINRRVKPIILVPDFDVQMLPWENLSVIKDQEVYRMPSVWSVVAAYKNEHKINPVHAYYLLNPDGSLDCRLDFEKLFKANKLKGKVRCAPPAEELEVALESQDLFIYIGHGSGSKYISNDRIERLQDCAGAVLCGCSSACLRLDGCYIPRGAPLSYLLAGSPFIFGNLWQVLEGDAHKLTYSMLLSWFKDRSYLKDDEQSLMIGTSMSAARNKCCRFPCLVGASQAIHFEDFRMKPMDEELMEALNVTINRSS